MLVQSKLFKLLSIIAIIIGFLVEHLFASEGQPLSYLDLQQPERLTQSLENGVSESQRRLAEDLYQSALKRKTIHRNWGAVAKYLAESALAYPTAKALMGLSESEAYLTQTTDPDAGRAALKIIKNYLNAALSVDKIQKQLSSDEITDLKKEIACLDAFISSGDDSQNPCQHVKIVLTR